jgi:hypothetical protein
MGLRNRKSSPVSSWSSQGPDRREQLINVSKDEYLRHRQLLPWVSRAATPHVIHKWDIFLRRTRAADPLPMEI